MTLPFSVRQQVVGQPVFAVQDPAASGAALVSVPYSIPGGANAESLVVNQILPDGSLETVRNSRYDSTGSAMHFLGLNGGMYAIGHNYVSFQDVAGTAWYHRPVSFAAARKLFDGVGGNRFDPQGTMTRAMFITVLARLDGVNQTLFPSSPYTDTAINTWYGPSVAWAAQAGIIDAGVQTGLAPGTFNPHAPISREQMAVIFANYIRYRNLALTRTELPVFEDIGAASTWAQSAIQDMRNHGIIHGVGNNRYNPQGSATRAEVAQIFMNLILATVG